MRERGRKLSTLDCACHMLGCHEDVPDSIVKRAYREVPEFDFFVCAGSDESFAVRTHSEGPQGSLVSLQINYKST